MSSGSYPFVPYPVSGDIIEKAAHAQSHLREELLQHIANNSH